MSFHSKLNILYQDLIQYIIIILVWIDLWLANFEKRGEKERCENLLNSCYYCEFSTVDIIEYNNKEQPVEDANQAINSLKIQRVYRGYLSRKKLQIDVDRSIAIYHREVDHMELLLRRGFYVQTGPGQNGLTLMLQLQGTIDSPMLCLSRLVSRVQHMREIVCCFLLRDVIAIQSRSHEFNPPNQRSYSTVSLCSNFTSESTSSGSSSLSVISAAGLTPNSPRKFDVWLPCDTDGASLSAAIRLMVDKQLTPADLRDRGRRQWWIEAIRPLSGQISAQMRCKAIAWMQSLVSSPIVVTSYPPDCNAAASLLRRSPRSINPLTSCCWSTKESGHIAVGTAMLVNASVSDPHASFPDILVLKSLSSGNSWWLGQAPLPSSEKIVCTSYVFDTQILQIRDIIEVRSGVDSGGFRWLVEGGKIDGEAHHAVCAGIFTQSESYCLQFSDQQTRDQFAFSLRIINKILQRSSVKSSEHQIGENMKAI